MIGRRALSGLLTAVIVAATGLAWPWPAVDRAPAGAIRGAEAATIRLTYPAPATACYRAGGAPEPWGAWTAVAASESASWVDRTGQGHTLTEVGAGTGWSTAGWTPGGVGALSTGRVLTATDTLLVYVANCPANDNTFAAGAFQDGPARAHLTPSWSGRAYAGWRSTATDIGAAMVTGSLALAGGQAYRDGSAVGTVPQSGSLPPTAAYLGAASYPFAQAYSRCRVRAAILWTATLTAAQLAAVNAACAAW